MKKLIVSFVGIFLFTGTAHAGLTILKNEEARNYLKDTKEHLFASPYTYESLTRSHRDSMYGRFSDATIFNKDGGEFLYIRRKQGDHVVALDPASGGRTEEPLTEDEWRRKVENVLNDDNPFPYVILDENQAEQGIVFVGRGTTVSAKRNSDNLVEITVFVQDGRSRGRK